MSKAHWQADTPNDTCFRCFKQLGRVNRRHHCRRCGRIFCDDCSCYEMKLNKDANHDPAKGVWCRVCQTCFEDRKGYLQEEGMPLCVCARAPRRVKRQHHTHRRLKESL